MLEVKVTGMTCQGCVRAVTKAIGRVAPDQTVTVDLPTGTVTVAGSPDRAAVEKAIAAAGFGVAAAA